MATPPGSGNGKAGVMCTAHVKAILRDSAFNFLQASNSIAGDPCKGIGKVLLVETTPFTQGEASGPPGGEGDSTVTEVDDSKLPRRLREKRAVKRIEDREAKRMNKGDKYYVVSYKWWGTWTDYTRYDKEDEPYEPLAEVSEESKEGGDSDSKQNDVDPESDTLPPRSDSPGLPTSPSMQRRLSESRNISPGPMIHDDLLDTTDDSKNVLRRDIQVDNDYVFLHEDSYNYLKEIYTVAESGVEFERDVFVKKGEKQGTISMYPIFVHMRLYKKVEPSEDQAEMYVPDDSTLQIIRMSDKARDTLRLPLIEMERRWKKIEGHPLSDMKTDEPSQSGDDDVKEMSENELGATIGERWRLTVEMDGEDGFFEVSEEMLDSWKINELATQE